MQNTAEHLKNNVTTNATCFKLTLQNGSRLGFTDFDKDLLIDGILYNAKSGLEQSSIEINTDLSLDNLNVTGILNSPLITETDLLFGKYNNASIEIFLVNYNNISQGKIVLKTGFINEIKVINGKFHAEIYGLSSKLEASIGQLYSPTCRATLGDKKCKVDLNGYTKNGTVTTAIDNISFIDINFKEESGYYDDGNLTFITGRNKLLSSTVKLCRNNKITLYNPMPYRINTANKYTIIAGCNKNFSTCSLKFRNSANFRGEPHVPGNSNV